MTQRQGQDPSEANSDEMALVLLARLIRLEKFGRGDEVSKQERYSSARVGGHSDSSSAACPNS